MLVPRGPLAGAAARLSDAGNDPAGTTRKAYDLLADGFGPGFNGPLMLVAQTGSRADQAALQTWKTSLPHGPA